MKDKFIRIVPPISFFVIAVFDLAAVALTAVSVANITKRLDFYSVCFVIIQAVIIIVAALTTREQLKNGVLFKADGLEFTALDENNEFKYSEIERAEVFKDTTPSFKKRLVQRYSSVILYLKDGSVATIELGLTTKRALIKTEQELNERLK